MKKAPTRQRRKKVSLDRNALGERFAKVQNPLVKIFATRLMKWRQAEGKTLKDIASDLELSVSIICEWEHGRRFPSVDHLHDLAKYTGVPAWMFLKNP